MTEWLNFNVIAILIAASLAAFFVRDDTPRWVAFLGTAYITTVFSIVVWIGYVAVHFIGKYW